MATAKPRQMATPVCLCSKVELTPLCEYMYNRLRSGDEASRQRRHRTMLSRWVRPSTIKTIMCACAEWALQHNLSRTDVLHRSKRQKVRQERGRGHMCPDDIDTWSQVNEMPKLLYELAKKMAHDLALIDVAANTALLIDANSMRPFFAGNNLADSGPAACDAVLPYHKLCEMFVRIVQLTCGYTLSTMKHAKLQGTMHAMMMHFRACRAHMSVPALTWPNTRTGKLYSGVAQQARATAIRWRRLYCPWLCLDLPAAAARVLLRFCDHDGVVALDAAAAAHCASLRHFVVWAQGKDPHGPWWVSPYDEKHDTAAPAQSSLLLCDRPKGPSSTARNSRNFYEGFRPSVHAVAEALAEVASVLLRDAMRHTYMHDAEERARLSRIRTNAHDSFTMPQYLRTQQILRNNKKIVLALKDLRTERGRENVRTLLSQAASSFAESDLGFLLRCVAKPTLGAGDVFAASVQIDVLCDLVH